ncbi:MAG: signal peptidase II [Christensenellaceae bacterium]|jgi:signal peptidase II|nr:signal peptidase II [Christensenellaceae bacterium]
MRNKTLIFIWLFEIACIALFVVFDLWSKTYYFKLIEANGEIVLINKVLYFIVAENTGAGFSLFSNNASALGTFSFVMVSVIFVVLICLTNLRYKTLKFALVLIVAGGLGNAIDRVQFGFVRDFIDLRGINYPIFNLADVELVIGMILLVVFISFIYRPEPAKAKVKVLN